MKMKFSTTVWKYALLTLNILISLLGLAFVSCGVVALGGVGSIMGAYTITLIGVGVLAICFVGCCAALRESYVLSMAFVASAAAGIVMQIIFMIVFLVMRDTLEEMGVERIEDYWEKELEDSGAMDKIQRQYTCCGKESPQDYIQDDDDVLPNSCCRYDDCSIPTNIFAKGCTIGVLNFFEEQGNNLILVSLGIIAIEIMGLVSAYYLGKTVEHRVVKSDRIVINE